MDKAKQRRLFDAIAPHRDRWKRRNWYYHEQLRDLVSSMVLPNSAVLEIGCGTGDLISYLRPARGVGIDFSEEMIRIARQKHPSILYCVGDDDALPISGTFDYVILSDLIGHLLDVWQACKELRWVTRPDTRIIITYFNYLWEPILRLADRVIARVLHHGCLQESGCFVAGRCVMTPMVAARAGCTLKWRRG